MSSPTGFTPTSTIARQIAQANQKANPDARPQNASSQGPRAAVFANATAPSASAAAPTAQVAAPSVAAAASAAPASAPGLSLASAAPGQLSAVLIASNAKLAVSLANQPTSFQNLSASAATQSGEVGEKDRNKKKVSEDVNRATRIGDESTKALKQTDNSAMGGDDTASGAATGPGSTPT